MIYLLLTKDNTNHRTKIIDYIRKEIKENNFEYNIIFCKKHIIESDLNHINKEKDIVLWQPLLAYDNLELLKTFQNSIVILSKPTVFVQKISKYNPINENMAINHGFFILYISPRKIDITNNEWKLVVKEDMYLITIEQLKSFILKDKSNIRKEKIDVPDIFESIVDFTKNQINLS